MLIKFKSKHGANIKGNKEEATNNTQGDPPKYLSIERSFNRNSSCQMGMAGDT